MFEPIVDITFIPLFMGFIGDFFKKLFGGGTTKINLGGSLQDKTKSHSKSYSGPNKWVAPYLAKLYQDGLGIYNKGWNPYQGEWHAGPSAPLDNLVSQLQKPGYTSQAMEQLMRATRR